MKLHEMRRLAAACPVPNTASGVLFVLLTHVGSEPLVWPSQETIGDIVGVSDRSVRNSLKALEAANVIKRTGRRVHGVTEYRINIALLEAACSRKSDPHEAEAGSTGSDCLTGNGFQSDRNSFPPTPETISDKEQGRATEGQKEIPLSAESAEPPSDSKILFDEARRILPDLGVPSKQIGGLVGQWRNQLKAGGRAETDLIEILREAEIQHVAKPQAWVPKAIQARAKPKAGRRVQYIQGVAVEA